MTLNRYLYFLARAWCRIAPNHIVRIDGSTDTPISAELTYSAIGWLGTLHRPQRLLRKSQPRLVDALLTFEAAERAGPSSAAWCEGGDVPIPRG